MKTILSILLFGALSLSAQFSPVPPPDTNRTEALRRAVRGANTNSAAAEQFRVFETNGGAIPAPALPAIPTTNAVTNAPAVNVPVAPVTPPAPPATAVSTTPGPPPSATVPAVPIAAADAVMITNAVEEPLIGASLIDWPAANLEQVLKIYGEYVGRTIIRPATLALAQPIVLKNQTALTKKELIQLLDAVLAINGIQMVNIGDKFVKALPGPQANTAGAALHTNDSTALPDLGGYTTHVVQLKYSKPSELMPALTPFASFGLAASAILPIENSGILVLRDNAENVKRMLEMIERLDVTVPSEFISEVIPIKFAKAEEIASALNSLSSGGGGTTVGGSTRGATTRPGVAGGARPGQPGYNPSQINNPNQPITPGGVPGAGVPSSGASFSDRLRGIIQRASASGDLTIIGQTKIIADARSNSLLIFAMRPDMDMIKDIISKLDVVLAQVLIETIIMDVSLDNSWSFGVSAGQNPYTRGKFTGGGVYNNNGNLNTLDQFFGTAATNLGSIFPSSSGLSYFGRYNGDFDVAVQAAAADSRVNVIQKPRIQTSHATPASIFVGNTVPYVSSTYYGGGYAGGPSSSYQQLQVGIGLNVTPFINQDGLVVMTIDQTIDEISGSTAITGVGDVPNTTHRTLSAEVAVRDRESIILGGFIRNSDLKTRSGVPILKDIPLLGALFSSRGSAKERKELIVLMRPTVLKTPELAAAHVAEEKRRLPGVSRAERELEREEQKVAERERQREFKETTPFTSDELKLFKAPPPELHDKP